LRIWLLALLAILAGCSTTSLRDGAAGLDVARAALASGSPEIALKISTDRLRTQPGDVAAMVVEGDALAALGRRAEAGAAFRQALAMQPDSVAARIGLGRLALADDPPRAEALLREVVAREPRNAVALNDLGIALDLQGRHAAAQEAYRSALGAAPDMQAAMVNLALSLGLSGQAAQGADLLRPLAAAPDATPRVRHDFAIVSALAGDQQAAAQAFGADLPPDKVRAALRALDAFAPPVSSRSSP
jgi:Flp pilus assembly protein TadD